MQIRHPLTGESGSAVDVLKSIAISGQQYQFAPTDLRQLAQYITDLKQQKVDLLMQLKDLEAIEVHNHVLADMRLKEQDKLGTLEERNYRQNLMNGALLYSLEMAVGAENFPALRKKIASEVTKKLAERAGKLRLSENAQKTKNNARKAGKAAKKARKANKRKK